VTEFGSYTLLDPLARGGMAEVYRARRRGHRRVLALKRIRPELASDPKFVDMFQREGQLALMLGHRCIVETVDAGDVDGRPYIAMEYIAGHDVRDLLKHCRRARQRLPIPHVVYIAARVAEGLHFAHTLQAGDGRPLHVVNRDVSPSNVRVSYDGDVKILDFGIASAQLQFTSEIGVIKGKYSYMSPEQIRGLPLDARSDVFSAGVLLHEMLTLEKLYRADSEFDLIENVCRADIPLPSRLNHRVGAELDEICARALARDVSERFQTAAQLALSLDALLVAYRFDRRELGDLVRRWFRPDHGSEISLRRDS
jgi:serine/threonine protein kinase